MAHPLKYSSSHSNGPISTLCGDKNAGGDSKNDYIKVTKCMWSQFCARRQSSQNKLCSYRNLNVIIINKVGNYFLIPLASSLVTLSDNTIINYRAYDVSALNAAFTILLW